MNTNNLLYIEDAKKRKLFYRFTPATVISNFVPLVVVLHEHGISEITNLEYKMWNILTPLDNFGYENKGSYWLGENGDFFVIDLLQELIHKIAEEYECEDHIYLYGSSMGGYGAILHGILCKANAVYAHAPQIRLVNTNNEDYQKKQVLNSIFSENDSKENNLNNFLNPIDSFPIFYLSKSESDDKQNIKDETEDFADRCKEHDIKVYLELSQKSHDDEHKDLKEVLDFFERVISQE